MEKITSTTQLLEAIALLEFKQKQEEFLLKEQFKTTYESLKPASLIKSTIHNLIATPNLKTNLLGTALSLAAGYASKKIVESGTQSPIKNMLGLLLQVGVTSLVANKSEGLISGISSFINNSSPKKLNTLK